jgi:hypothetical protein
MGPRDAVLRLIDPPREYPRAVAPDHAEQRANLDDTVVRAPSAPAMRIAQPDLDDTIVSAGRVGTPAPARAVAPPAPPPALAPPSRAPRVRLPDGRVLVIDGGTVYLGRRPTLPRVPASGVPQLVALAAPRREVSATHLALSVVGDAIVVRDMLSTNGTVVKTPGVPARTLLRGESVVVTPGTILDLGDGNVLEVLP